MADREHILADFQAVSGIDDVEQCITVLEENNWDLQKAARQVLEHEDVLPEPLSASNDLPPIFDGEKLPLAAGSGSSYEFPPLDIPSVSGINHFDGTLEPFSRMLNFDVEYRDRMAQLVMKDSDTVGQMKTILSEKFEVPTSNMVLRGWKNSCDDKIKDGNTLRSLKLPKENILFLLTPVVPVSLIGDDKDEIRDRLGKKFILNVHNVKADKKYTLHYEGTKTMAEIKSDIASLTGINIGHQVWEGASFDDDSLTIAGAAINYPSHDLSVYAKSSNHRRKFSQKNQYKSDDDEEDDDNDYVVSLDEEDESEIDVPNHSIRHQVLLPPNSINQTVGLEKFSDAFSERYGPRHPIFFIGSLSEALKHALQVPARNKKMLCVYLHHDHSILANVFCSQILCSETVVDYLSNNFVTWAWDFTCPENKEIFLATCQEHFGSIGTSAIQRCKSDDLPLMVLVSRNRSTNEIVTMIGGNVPLDELMTQLIQSVEVFNSQQQSEIKEEEERDRREEVLRDQNVAYEESLAIDRAKAIAKRRKEEEEEIEKKREETSLLEKADRQRRLLETLPAEPSELCAQPVSNIRIRVPGNKTLSRRFLADEPLRLLLTYIESEGYECDTYKIITTYPRRDLTQSDPQLSLKELKLYPQETVNVEEK